MTRVVQVIAPAPFGGAESVVRHLSESLRHCGVAVMVVAIGVSRDDHPWISDMRGAGFVVEVIPPMGLRREQDRLRAVLAAFDADIVHTHGYKSDVAGLLASSRRVKWVSTVHGFTHLNWRTTVYQWIDRMVLRRADAVVAVSSAIVAELHRWRVPITRVHLVRNTPRRVVRADRDAARRELGLDHTTPAIAWIGRFSHEKGPDRLPVLARGLRCACSLVLVGDGPLRAETLDALATDVGDTTVRWLGARSDIAGLMKAFDALVLPSRSEGMPMVLLEAMAAGVPVVSFDVGDVSSALNSSNGWLIAAEDVPAFVSAVNDVLMDAQARASRGAAAALTVARDFSTEAWAAAYLRVYDATRPGLSSGAARVTGIRQHPEHESCA